MAIDRHLETLFQEIERAVDAHPSFKRPEVIGEPELSVTRLGYTMKIKVIGKGRRRPEEISGDGHSAEEATEDLISGLDYWAEAMRR